MSQLGDRCQGYLHCGTQAPWCHPHVGGGPEQLKQKRGAGLGSGVTPAPHRPLPNLSTTWSVWWNTEGRNIGLGHPRGHPDGTCHLQHPRAGSVWGCGWASPSHPRQGTQRHLLTVSATAAGWGAGGISLQLPPELRSWGEHPTASEGMSWGVERPPVRDNFGAKPLGTSAAPGHTG